MHVLFGGDLDPVLSLAFDRFLDLRRDAGGKHAIGNLDALPHNAAGSDQRAFADHAAVEKYRVAADQCVRFDVTVFHHGAVADGHVVVDLCQRGYMKNGVVLDRCASADTDRTVVAAEHRPKPNTRLLAHFDVADEDGGGGDERSRVDFWGLATVRDDHGAK